jgi:hypothetical protein
VGEVEVVEVEVADGARFHRSLLVEVRHPPLARAP